MPKYQIVLFRSYYIIPLYGPNYSISQLVWIIRDHTAIWQVWLSEGGGSREGNPSQSRR